MNAPFTALACLAFCLCGFPALGLAQDQDAAFSVSHPLPQPPAQIIVPMKLGGAERLFIFDTGTDRALIDPSLHTADMPILGEASVNDGSGNKTKSKIVQLPGFTDQSHTFPAEFGGLMSMEVLSRYLGRPVAGVLGMRQLGKAKIYLDYQEAKLTIHNGAWKLNPDQATEIALNPGLDAPKIQSTLGDRPITFTIDTGHTFALSLITADFTALVQSGLIQEVATTSRAVSVVQEFRPREGIFQGGTLMGKELKGMPVFTGPSVLGLGWLCAFQIELDLKERKLRYRPIENPKEPIVQDLMLGAALIYQDGKAVIARLQPGGKGAFEKAGLHSASIINLLAAKAGQSIEIEYLRGDSTTPSKINVTLPPLITEWGEHRVRPPE